MSRGHLFQDGQIERVIGDNPREAQILLLQPLQPRGLIHAQPAVLLLPAIGGVLGDPELPAGVEHGQTFAGVELHRPQMLNTLFGRIPLLGHDLTSLVAVQSPIHPGPNLPGQVMIANGLLELVPGKIRYTAAYRLSRRRGK